MKNRKLILIVSLVLAMTMSLGGTLAYLTDTDGDVNTMVLGNVKITQNEQQRIEIGNAAAGLESFEDGQMMLPAVYDLATDPAREVVNVNGYEITYGGGMRTFPNYMDKIVTVTNNGNTNAYVRTLIAVPVSSNEEYADGNVSENWLHYNCVSDTDTVPANGWYYGTSVEAGEYPALAEQYIIDNVVINGAVYEVAVVTNVNKIAKGETTGPNLVGLYLDNDVDYKDGKYYAKDSDTNELVEVWSKSEMKVYVLSQAVQADGFGDAFTAFSNSFGDVTKDLAEQWFNNGNIPQDTPSEEWPSNNPPEDGWTIVSNGDELVEALVNNEDVMFKNDIKIDPANMSNAYGKTGINVLNGQTINGNGKTLDVKGAGGTWDSGICTSGGLIKDITVTGSFRGIFVKGGEHTEKVVLENVIVDGTTYTISIDQASQQGLSATNCTFNGWTSYAATIGNVEFVNCNFGAGNGYNFSRPYAPTTYVNCNFAEGHKMDPRAAVTFENCTIGGVALTAENLSTLVTSRIENATVK